MNYPDLPKTHNLRLVPVIESEVVSWNTAQELCTTHDDGDTIVAPEFIVGDSASLVFSKRGNYAYVGGVEIRKVFNSLQEAWTEACYDAVELSGSEGSIERLSGTIEVSCAAQKLLNSMEWWSSK